jgi:hypothetical protein
MDAREILCRFEKLKNAREKYHAVWSVCQNKVAALEHRWDNDMPDEEYAIPARPTGKPSNYLNTCVTGIAGYAVSPNIKWFKLSLSNKDMLVESGVARWLEQCEGVLRRVFEVCGLYQKTIPWLEQSGIYGQGAMLIEEMRNSDAPIRYHVPEMNEIYLDDNELGNTELVYRCYWSDMENVINYYGRKAMHKDFIKRFDDMRDSDGYLNAGADTSTRLIHAVFLRRTGAPDGSETVGNKKWASIIVDVQNKHIIKESGYDDFPYALFFWEKSNKPYGVSPTMKALNDIRIYQEAYTTLLTMMQYAANPLMAAPESQRENVKEISPGGTLFFRSGEGAPNVINTGANYPVAVQILEQLQNNIKEWYNVDFFLMLRQYQNVQNMTATAVSALQGEQTALLAALVSNLYSGLSKIITRTFNILAKKGLLPELPFALTQTGGSVRIDFQGVLAQAQKAAYEYTGLMDVLSIGQSFVQMSKVDPEYGRAALWINPEAVFKKAVESRGAPAEVLRTKEEYEKIVGAINDRDNLSARTEADELKRQAVLQNAQNLNEPVNPNSMLAGMLGK